MTFSTITGRTALLWSINNSNLEMLEFLCDMGVDLSVRNYFRETSLFTAASLYIYNRDNSERRNVLVRTTFRIFCWFRIFSF